MSSPTIRSALIRIDAACAVTGESRRGFYKKVQEGLMPHPVKIGRRASALPANEIESICKARIAGKSEAEIRLLVKHLEACRKHES
ncbi:MAG: transcriptional regulator [Aquabacterium sp.]